MRIGEPKEIRNDGKTVEYERMIVMSGGVEIPESRLAEYHAAQKKEQRRPENLNTGKLCPLKHGSWCRKDCALFRSGVCGVKLQCRGQIDETEGKKCPFDGMGICSDKCGFYTQRGCCIQGLMK